MACGLAPQRAAHRRPQAGPDKDGLSRKGTPVRMRTPGLGRSCGGDCLTYRREHLDVGLVQENLARRAPHPARCERRESKVVEPKGIEPSTS